MKGINYITDENNKKMAVVIDLKTNGSLWEDFYDYMIANKRKNEEKIPFEKVITNLKKAGKL
jgi:predicted transcriptional regulator YdeE